jgi:hypothetical protein
MAEGHAKLRNDKIGKFSQIGCASRLKQLFGDLGAKIYFSTLSSI